MNMFPSHLAILTLSMFPNPMFILHMSVDQELEGTLELMDTLLDMLEVMVELLEDILILLLATLAMLLVDIQESPQEATLMVPTTEQLPKKSQLNLESNIFPLKRNILSMTEFKESKEFLLKDKLLNMKK